MITEKTYDCKYTFIIPIYNCEQNIKNCLAPLLKLNRKDYEIILINDGSTDSSDVICRKIAEKTDTIRYYSQGNQGVSTARNVGIENANGKYIIFIDADDSIDIQKMNKLLDEIADSDDIDMAIYGMSFDYYYRRRIYYRELLLPILLGKVKKEVWSKKIYQLYECNSLSSACNKIIKKNILISNNIRFRQDMFIYEDLEFSLNCLQYTNSILFIEEALYFYRQSEDQGNAGRRLARIENLNELLSKIEEPLENLCKDGSMMTQKDSMLINLYLTLAREKMEVSSTKEIRLIQHNFADWLKSHRFNLTEKQKVDVDRVLRQSPISFKKHLLYIRFRHYIAVRVKSVRAKGKKSN